MVMERDQPLAYGISSGPYPAGDYPPYPNTAFSIELSATSDVINWEQAVRIMLEEDAFFDASTYFLNIAAESPILVPRH